MLTIFTICKPFVGHSRIIQTNAIKSWTLLKPRPQIILFGDELGIAEIAGQLNVQHAPKLKRNQQGTPLLNDAFFQSHQLAENDILVYVNADIIFFNDMVLAVKRVQTTSLEQFLIIGRRTNLALSELIDFENANWEEQLRLMGAKKGTLVAAVCKDYFIFTKPLYAEIPEFAVGRGNWDSWLVAQAHRKKIPVIDATPILATIHQNHDYAHLGGGAVASVIGMEARQNARLGGGMNLIYGSASNWQLTADGLKRKRLSALTSFLLDLPRFFRLLRYLFSLR